MIEIYGIENKVGKCYACQRVRSLLDELGIEYKFYSVITNDEKNGIVYDRELIESLAKRLDLPNLNIGYPVIFADNNRIKNFTSLKDYLLLNGADPDIILDY